MKYQILALLFLLASCTGSDNQNKPKKLTQKIATTISGQISNPNYPNIILEAQGEKFNAGIQNGNFTFNLMLDEPRMYSISYGRRSGLIYVIPGDQLSLSTSANQFSQVMNFTGDRAVENQYLTEKADKDRKARSMKVKLYKMEEQEFIEATDKDKEAKMLTLENFKLQNEIDPFFAFLMKSEIEYEWANDRLIYPRYHGFYTQNENFQPSPVYYDFERAIDRNDPAKLWSPNFTSFISNYSDWQVTKLIEKDESFALKDNGRSLAKFNVIADAFTNEEIKEYLMYTTLKTHIKYEGANGTPELIKLFEERSANQNFKNDIQNDYAIWRGLESGNQAPTFAYADIDGQVHDMASYKGKYIYVDIWATWCGPCKREIPHLEALQEEYKDNDKILFTSVSIDKDKSAWERMVKDQNMKGLQLFAEGEWRSSIVRDYKISGIPRFLLIDDQGKIVSANAARPSSDRIKAQLASLLD